MVEFDFKAFEKARRLVKEAFVPMPGGQPPPMDPNAMDPNAMDPSMMDPNMMDPSMMDPNMMDPNMMDPNMMDPNMMDPGMIDPNMMDPGMMDPAAAAEQGMIVMSSDEFTNLLITIIQAVTGTKTTGANAGADSDGGEDKKDSVEDKLDIILKAIGIPSN